MRKGKMAQLLSPEKYIRTRARSLPIGPCYINENWADAGMALIIITRKHTNGNFTFASFQVDIYCLGVKDAFCEFNMHPLDFQEYRDKFSELSDNEVSLIETTYPLAHNIIYGAIEYAEELGFKPGNGFDLAQCILEEDDDRIELIDVEFGLDGKPTLIAGSESDTEATIAQLNRSVGKGNYSYTISDELPDDLYNDENMDDIPDYRDPDVQKKNIDRFIDLMSQLKETQPEESQGNLLDEAINLADILYYTVALPEDAYEEAEEEVMSLCDFDISDERISDAILFGSNTPHPRAKEIRQEIEKINDIREDEISGLLLKKVRKLEKEYPDVPGIAYTRLKMLEALEKEREFSEELKGYMKKYPDYIPFRYFHAWDLMHQKNIAEGIALADSMAEIEKVWPGTTSFCEEQTLLHIQNLQAKYTATGQLHYIDALIEYFQEDYPDLIHDAFFQTPEFLKLILITRLLEIENSDGE